MCCDPSNFRLPLTPSNQFSCTEGILNATRKTIPAFAILLSSSGKIALAQNTEAKGPPVIDVHVHARRGHPSCSRLVPMDRVPESRVLSTLPKGACSVLGSDVVNFEVFDTWVRCLGTSHSLTCLAGETPPRQSTGRQRDGIEAL